MYWFNIFILQPSALFAQKKAMSLAGTTYEDIDADIYERGSSPQRTMSFQGTQGSEYLEPINRQESFDRNSLLSEMNFFEDGTPKPAPRLPRHFHQNVTHLTGEQYVLLYANKEILADKTQSPVNIRDGYFHMASANLETLHRLADQIYSKVLAPIDTKMTCTKLCWSDFVKTDTKPVLSQGSVAFYRVKGHNAKKVDLKEFLIMVSTLISILLSMCAHPKNLFDSLHV